MNANGRIVSDWFKINGDDRSWCYVMYENEAGHTHMVEYAQFFLQEGHQHYDQKIDIVDNQLKVKPIKAWAIVGKMGKIYGFGKTPSEAWKRTYTHPSAPVGYPPCYWCDRAGHINCSKRRGYRCIRILITENE